MRRYNRCMNARWKPNVTVAAIVERAGRFLFVEEETEAGLALNQPAGHLDEGESLIEACARETFEETGWRFRPQVLVGIYLWPRPDGVLTYLRFAFAGELLDHEAQQPLDEGIVRTLWLSRDGLIANRARHRSPLVLQCVDDYLAGRRHALDLIRHWPMNRTEPQTWHR